MKTKPRKHGSDKNHAKRSTRIQKRLNDGLKDNAHEQFNPYLSKHDELICHGPFTDREMAYLLRRSLYAIRARRKRLKQTA